MSGFYHAVTQVSHRTCLVAFLLIPLILLPSGYQFANLPKFLVLQVSAVLVSTGVLLRACSGDDAPDLPLPLLLFLVVSIVQFGRSLNPDEASLLLLTLTGSVAIGFGASEERLETLATVVAVGGGLVAFVGVLEALGVAAAQLPSAGRPSSTLGFRNVAANYAAGCLPFGLYLLTRRVLYRRIAGGAVTFLVTLFILYTRSRGAWVGVSVSAVLFILWFIRHRKHKVVSLPGLRPILVAAAATLFLLYLGSLDLRFEDRSPSRLDEKKHSLTATVRLLAAPDGDRDRFRIWSHTVEMAADHPVAGVGLGNWSAVYPAYDLGDVLHLHSAPRRPHNDFLWILSELGAPGLILFVWVLVAAARTAFRHSNPLRIVSLCAFSAIAVHSLFSFPREQAAPSLLFWLSIGIATQGRPSVTRRTLQKAVWAGLALLSLAGMVTGWRAILTDQAYARALRFQIQDLPRRQLESAAESLDIGTFDHRAFLLAGDAFGKLHLYKEAVAIYERYREVQPNLGAVHNNLGRAMNAVGDHESAEAVLLKGREVLPNDRWILNNLAESYRRQGLGEKARSLFDGLSSLTAGDHHNLGLLAAEADSFDQARDHYEEALRLNSDMHEIRYSLAGLMLLEGDLEGAIRSYEEYLESPEPNPTLVRRTKGRLRETYFAYGRERLKLGDAQEARRLLEHGSRLGKATANDEHALAMAYGKLSLFAEAADAARRATEKDPDLLAAFLTLANALYELRAPEAAGYYEVFLERWHGDQRLAELARGRLKRLQD